MTLQTHCLWSCCSHNWTMVGKIELINNIFYIHTYISTTIKVVKLIFIDSKSVTSLIQNLNKHGFFNICDHQIWSDYQEKPQFNELCKFIHQTKVTVQKALLLACLLQMSHLVDDSLVITIHSMRSTLSLQHLKLVQVPLHFPGT